MADVLRSTPDGIVCIGRLDLGEQTERNMREGMGSMRVPKMRKVGSWKGSAEWRNTDDDYMAIRFSKYHIDGLRGYGINADDIPMSILRTLKGFKPISFSEWI